MRMQKGVEKRQDLFSFLAKAGPIETILLNVSGLCTVIDFSVFHSFFDHFRNLITLKHLGEHRQFSEPALYFIGDSTQIREWKLWEIRLFNLNFTVLYYLGFTVAGKMI